LDLVEKEFGVHFTEADHASLDGTFDNLVRLVHIMPRIKQQASHPLDFGDD
jgi:hypothetical protein